MKGAGLVGPVILLMVWEVAVRNVAVLKFSLGSPSGIVVQLWRDAEFYPPNLATTAYEAVVGFLIGNLVAIALAVAVVSFQRFGTGLMQVAVAVRVMPLLVIAPIISVVLVGASAKIALAALSVFFPTLVATIVGLRAADAAALDVVRAVGGGRWAAIAKVRLPASVPWIFAGLKVAAPAAVLGAILGEFMGGNAGLGVAMVNAMAALNTDRVWGLAVVSSLMAGGGFGLMSLVARWLVPWAPDLTVGSPSASLGHNHGRLEAVRSTLLLACGSTLGVLLLWVALLHLFQVNPFFGRGPDAVLRDLFISPAAASHRLILLDALGTTIFDAMLGFVVGTGLATAIATLFVAYPVLARWFMPLAIGLRSVPVIAATPLLVVIFGRGLGVSIAIATLFTFFPTLINVMEGLRSAPPRAIELMHAYAASRWTTIRKVRMVYALPSMFASARISILGSVLGVLVAEWLATGVGLGSVMIQARAEYDFDHLWTAGVVLTVASAAIYASVGWLEASMARP